MLMNRDATCSARTGVGSRVGLGTSPSYDLQLTPRTSVCAATIAHNRELICHIFNRVASSPFREPHVEHRGRKAISGTEKLSGSSFTLIEAV
jgi:hypothetical protein